MLRLFVVVCLFFWGGERERGVGGVGGGFGRVCVWMGMDGVTKDTPSMYTERPMQTLSVCQRINATYTHQQINTKQKERLRTVARHGEDLDLVVVGVRQQQRVGWFCVYWFLLNGPGWLSSGRVCMYTYKTFHTHRITRQVPTHPSPSLNTTIPNTTTKQNRKPLVPESVASAVGY